MVTDRSDLRKRAGMSLRQLSQACGVSVSQLSKYERGECRLPDHERATVAAILRERLNETPKFATDSDVEQFLEKSGE